MSEPASPRANRTANLITGALLLAALCMPLVDAARRASRVRRMLAPAAAHGQDGDRPSQEWVVTGDGQRSLSGPVFVRAKDSLWALAQLGLTVWSADQWREACELFCDDTDKPAYCHCGTDRQGKP